MAVKQCTFVISFPFLDTTI